MRISSNRVTVAGNGTNRGDDTADVSDVVSFFVDDNLDVVLAAESPAVAWILEGCCR